MDFDERVISYGGESGEGDGIPIAPQQRKRDPRTKTTRPRIKRSRIRLSAESADAQHPRHQLDAPALARQARALRLMGEIRIQRGDLGDALADIERTSAATGEVALHPCGYRGSSYSVCRS